MGRFPSKDDKNEEAHKMIKEAKVIIIILIQYILSLYLSLYIFYKILLINVLDLLVPLKIMAAILLLLICFFTINILIYRFISFVKKQKEGVYSLDSKEIGRAHV